MKTKQEIKEFIDSCKDNDICKFSKCLKSFINGEKEITYIASTPQGYNYNGYQRGTVRYAVWTQDTGWEYMFSNLSFHRAKQVLKAIKENKINLVNPIVLNNYMTNGHSTKKGLFYNYTQEELERMERIARSHANYLGCETGDSTTDHENRVFMRNCY